MCDIEYLPIFSKIDLMNAGEISSGDKSLAKIFKILDAIRVMLWLDEFEIIEEMCLASEDFSSCL